MTLARRTLLIRLSAASLAGLPLLSALSGCQSLRDPLTVALTTSDIEQLLARSTQTERKVGDLFSVSFNSPHVQALQARKRLAVDAAVSVRERMLGGSWPGRVAFDTALRWDAATRTVRLVEPQVQDFRLEGPGLLIRGVAEKMAASLAEQMLDDFVVYRLPDDKAARLQLSGVSPASLEVTSSGILIHFESIRT